MAILLECCEHISMLISTAHVVYLNAHDSFPKLDALIYRTAA